MTHSNKKIRLGTVRSVEMQKSGVVVVERTVQHPLYKRTVRLSKRYIFHDENDECKPGDVIQIIECRPLSRRKRWRLLTIIKKAV